MKHPFTRSRRISKLALLAVLALVVISAPTTTSAAPASTNMAHRWPSEPADASHVASSAQIPTLANNVGQPAGGAEWQLPVGAGLLATGLLGLVYAITTRLTSDPTAHDHTPIASFAFAVASPEPRNGSTEANPDRQRPGTADLARQTHTPPAAPDRHISTLTSAGRYRYPNLGGTTRTSEPMLLIREHPRLEVPRPPRRSSISRPARRATTARPTPDQCRSVNPRRGRQCRPQGPSARPRRRVRANHQPPTTIGETMKLKLKRGTAVTVIGGTGRSNTSAEAAGSRAPRQTAAPTNHARSTSGSGAFDRDGE